jgi:hypothetical protein
MTELHDSSPPDDAAPSQAPGGAYCRACRATFERPLPTPYGGICPDCLGRGAIVTLTDPPRRGSRIRGRTRDQAAPAARRPAGSPNLR